MRAPRQSAVRRSVPERPTVGTAATTPLRARAVQKPQRPRLDTRPLPRIGPAAVVLRGARPTVSLVRNGSTVDGWLVAPLPNPFAEVPVDGGVSVPRATNECGLIRGVETIARAGDATVSTARALRRTDYRIATNVGALDSDFESVELDEDQPCAGASDDCRSIGNAVTSVGPISRLHLVHLGHVGKLASAGAGLPPRRSGRDDGPAQS